LPFKFQSNNNLPLSKPLFGDTIEANLNTSMKHKGMKYRHLDFSLDEIYMEKQILQTNEVHQLVEKQMQTIEKIRVEINKAFQRVSSMQYTAEMMRNLMRDLLDLA
jgi:light-regulated signal transduction histidine kinase (bacteriophytochrome)